MVKAEKASVIDEAVANRYWREDLAKELIAAQIASGLPLETFATKHGLLPERLRRWKRRFDGSVEDSGVHFLPVRVVEADSQEDSRAIPAVIEFVAGGRTVRVPPGFCDATLLRLVRLLESVPC